MQKFANSRKDDVQKLGLKHLRNYHRDNLKKLKIAERMKGRRKQRNIKGGNSLKIITYLPRISFTQQKVVSYVFLKKSLRSICRKLTLIPEEMNH